MSAVSDKNHVITISTGTFVKAILFGLGLWFLWYVREVVAVIFMAVLLAALIDPLADALARRRVPRTVTVIVVYILLAALLSFVVIQIVPVIFDQLSQFVANISTSPILGYLGRFRAATAEYGLEDNLRSALQSIQTGITSSFTSVFSTITGVIGAIATIFVVFVLTFYMVVEEEAVRRYFKNLAPEEYQLYLSGAFSKMQKKVGSWLRGQLALGLIIGIAVYIGLSLLGVHYALLLAVIAGLLEFVPYLGPILSLSPALIIAFGQSPLKALSVVVLYLVIQQLENNILVPKVMQKATGLNPVISIVALLIGAKVGGFLGAVLSIPLATMSSVLLEDLFHGDSARL